MKTLGPLAVTAILAMAGAGGAQAAVGYAPAARAPGAYARGVRRLNRSYDLADRGGARGLQSPFHGRADGWSYTRAGRPGGWGWAGRGGRYRRDGRRYGYGAPYGYVGGWDDGWGEGYGEDGPYAGTFGEAGFGPQPPYGDSFEMAGGYPTGAPMASALAPSVYGPGYHDGAYAYGYNGYAQTPPLPPLEPPFFTRAYGYAGPCGC